MTSHSFTTVRGTWISRFLQTVIGIFFRFWSVNTTYCCYDETLCFYLLLGRTATDEDTAQVWMTPTAEAENTLQLFYRLERIDETRKVS